MKSKIVNYLKDLEKEGKIKEFYYDNYNYWQGVPFVKLNNGKEVALVKTFYYSRSLCIKTIFDYKNISYVKEKINDIIEGGEF